MQSFRIDSKLPSLNEYQDACRANKYVGAQMKQAVEEQIQWCLKRAMMQGTLKYTEAPHRYHFIWHERTKKRDPDNICSAKKFIFDAMQKMGVIPRDSRKYVVGFTDDFLDSDTDYVEVLLEEVKEGEA